ncbi:MAG: nucleotidyltransferase family protein [Anaeromyxobacteraceae bacterium]
MRALFARATPAPDLPGLTIPSPEDHAILIAIHAAGHDFHHAAALLDLALLLRKGLDLPALAARARAWRARTALFVLFSLLRDLGAPEVSDAHVALFDPGPLRRAVLRRRAAMAASSNDLGLPWMIRQTPLRDDLGTWVLGLCRYAAVRGVERVIFGSARIRPTA